MNEIFQPEKSEITGDLSRLKYNFLQTRNVTNQKFILN